MAYLIILLMCAVCITLDYFLRQRGVLATASPAGATAWTGERAVAPGTGAAPALSEIDAGSLTNVPEGLFLAPGHTWLRLGPSGSVRVGSDRFPLTALGGVDRLDVAPEGTRIRQGDVLARMGRGERELRLLSPVEGEVTAVNEVLRANPEDLPADPYKGGWLCSIRPRRLASSLKRMVIAEDTQEWMRSELHRLRDTLSSRGGELVALADGGAPVQGLGDCLEQEDWEKFVECFFEDPVRPGSASHS